MCLGRNCGDPQVRWESRAARPSATAFVMADSRGIADHLTIGSYARIAAKSGVIRDVQRAKVVGGYPRCDPAVAPADRRARAAGREKEEGK